MIYAKVDNGSFYCFFRNLELKNQKNEFTLNNLFTSLYNKNI